MNNQDTKEKCLELANKCKNRTEFLKLFPKAYKYANENNWLVDFFGEVKQLPRNYWTKEKCFEIAKKCTSKIEFSKTCNHAYYKSLKNDWLKEMTWFCPPNKPTINSKDKIYTIYVYEDKNNFVCYVGLTKNLKRRIQTHKSKHYKTNKYDSVGEYFINLYGYIPNPQIIEDNLSLTEAQYCEDYWKTMYQSIGWLTLNKAKTGLNISSYGSIESIYTFEYCSEIAKQYETSKQLKKENLKIYNQILYKGWFNKMPWITCKKKNNFYNYEKCYELAKECTTVTEFMTKFNSAYTSARKNDWIKEYFWLIKIEKRELSKEYCFNLAKKYHSLKEFRHDNPVVWRKVNKNNWVKEYVWLQNDIPHELTYEECYNYAIQFPSREKYKTHFSFKYAKKNGWLDDWTWLAVVKTPNGFWDIYENCKEEAKKYKNRTEFSKKKQNAYQSSLKNKWIDDFFPIKK